MSVKSYKCLNCGAPLSFNADKQLFSCDYCDSDFAEEILLNMDAELLQKTDAQAESTAAAPDIAAEELLYNCPSCGAEIITEPTTAATICYFCHNPVVLVGKLANDERPHRVVPFMVSREKAVESFFAWMRKKKYVPRDFMSREQIDNISGVYYPYWLADYSGEASFSGEGIKNITHIMGDYRVTTTKHYDVERQMHVSYNDVARSALQKADHKLAEGVHPFDMQQAREFSPAYLSGFLAERRDIEAATVQPDIERELFDYTQNILRGQAGYDQLRGTTTVNYSQVDYKYCLLPTWVLTYKDTKGKHYYYAMNGQNGRTCGILPIAKAKLLSHSAIFGGIIAAALMIVGWLFI